MTTFTADAKPYAYEFPLAGTALLLIDMQRDFLLPGGFGEIQGADLTAVQAAIEPTRKLLDACRAAGLAVFHTREGQMPDMSDCPSSKTHRPAVAPGTQYTAGIGDKGKMGRMLIRGEYGHDFVDELRAVPGEVVIDKPGKGAFWQTELHYRLKARGITHLIICGVTTECCVTTTLREANDRGFQCCAVIEATSGYNDRVFKGVSLDMLHWSQGLFGFVGHLQPFLDALRPLPGRDLSSAAETPPQTPPEWDGDLSIPSLQAAYRSGLSPVKLVEALYAKIEAYDKANPGAWIHLVPQEAALAAARDLVAKFPDRTTLPPLYGVPYTVKDSIDVAGLPTTTACPPLRHTATTSAPVHDLVIAEGALFLGKANLDQLATGLTGQRSPYGAPSSVFHRSFISGGSSSGSAVLVGARLCSFSLATDTAGSGRVPAAFNGVIGFKPTRGTVPFVGVTPACLSLDCIAIMAASVDDARTVWRAVEGFSTADPYAKRPELRYYSRHVDSIGPATSQFRFGIPPPEALAACSAPYRRCFDEAVARLHQLGGRLQPVDWTPFRAAGDLLYDGSFVLERLASIPDLPGSDGADAATFLARHRADLHPVILDIFDAALARNTSAADAYRDLQIQAALTAQVRNTVFCQAASGVDVLVVPTAPTHFTVAEVAADPVRRNSLLGAFTHAGNVLDLCGVACPAGKFAAAELVEGEDGELPFGVTFLGGSLTDADVLKIAARFEDAARADGAI